MNTKTIILPEEAIINLLKTLPKDKLLNILWKTLVEIDISPLTGKEKKEIKKAMDEYVKRQTVKWEDIK